MIESVHKSHNMYLIMWEEYFTVLSTHHVTKACTVGEDVAGCIIHLGISGEPLSFDSLDMIAWSLRRNSPGSNGDYVIPTVPTYNRTEDLVDS
jgi:hypothetical protein